MTRNKTMKKNLTEEEKEERDLFITLLKCAALEESLMASVTYINLCNRFCEGEEEVKDEMVAAYQEAKSKKQEIKFLEPEIAEYKKIRTEEG